MRIQALATIIALSASALAQGVMRPEAQPAVLPGAADCFDGICANSSDAAPETYEPIVVDPTPSATHSKEPVLPSFSPSNSPALPSQPPSNSPAAPSASPTSSEEPVVPEPSASSSSSADVEITLYPAVIISATPSPASQIITCGIKESEGGVTCDADENLDTDKVCCRNSGLCGDLNKCTETYCCTDAPVASASPSSAPSVTPTASASPNAVVSESPTASPDAVVSESPSPNNDYINCGIKESEGGVTCDADENLDASKECCRNSGLCGELSKCTETYCCTDGPVASASPSPSTGAVESTTPAPTPTATIPDSDYITCSIKDSESPLECEILDDDKDCCRYSGQCGNMSKCTPSYCCKETTPTPTPHPSPSTTPSYEPVDNYINCAVKRSEGGFKCHGDEVVDAHKECCRWSDECGDLRKCTESYCCTDDDIPQPSPSAHPGDYTMKCKEKSGLDCSIGYEMDANKECCEYPGACGDLRACKSDYCCVDSGTAPPVDTEGACDCAGAVLNKRCYSTLKKAIRAASNGDTIYVGGDIKVDSPITFDQSLSFSGVLCDSARAQIIATFDEVDGAIFEAVNEDAQEVNFSHLAITSAGGNSAAAFHSLGTVTNAPDQTISMTLTNVWIHDMYSQRPGVGIFIGSSSGLTVDDDCIFQSLKMSTSEMDMYAGGAAIAVVYLPEDGKINIAGYFKDNSAFYPEASLHSGGGAVYLDYMEGDVTFTAAFEKNSANQGGAVNVQGVLGTMVVDGYFSENSAIDDGYGARAGAFRLLDIKEGGVVLFNGSFIGNTAQGRGGAIATNMHRSGSTMYLDGIFQNNVASTVGGVWSLWSNTDLDGKVKLRGDSVFQGNLAVYDDSDSGIYDIAAGDHDVDKLAEDEWFGRTITVN